MFVVFDFVEGAFCSRSEQRRCDRCWFRGPLYVGLESQAEVSSATHWAAIISPWPTLPTPSPVLALTPIWLLRDSQDLRHATANGRSIRHQLRLLGVHDAIQIDNRQARFPHSVVRRSEHVRRVPPPVCGVRVGEHLADVAQRTAAEHGIRDGVQQHVRIAMPREVPVERNVAAPDPKGSSVLQPMAVVSDPDAIGGRDNPSLIKAWTNKQTDRLLVLRRLDFTVDCLRAVRTGRLPHSVIRKDAVYRSVLVLCSHPARGGL